MSFVKERESASGMEGGWESMRAREQVSWEIREGDVSIKTRAAEGASCAKNRGESIAGKANS